MSYVDAAPHAQHRVPDGVDDYPVRRHNGVPAGGMGYGLTPSRTYCDNQAVVFAMRKRDLTSKSRHIRVHLGFCYDMLDCDGVKILYVGTEVNPANGLTAAEAPDRFARTMDAVTGREPQGKPAQLRSRKNSAL